MKNYNVLQEFNLDGVGDVVVGQELSLDEETAAPLVAENVIEEKVENEEVKDEEVFDTTSEKVIQYMKQDIISDSLKDINGVTYHHIRIADGSEYDLSDEEYEANVA